MVLLSSWLLIGQASYAADSEKGRKLHGENCVTCHKSLTNEEPDSLYTRENRRVTSLDALQKQVERCQFSLGLQWFDDEIATVTQYLNDNFYHF